jgi:hypothetical protein
MLSHVTAPSKCESIRISQGKCLCNLLFPIDETLYLTTNNPHLSHMLKIRRTKKASSDHIFKESCPGMCH